MWHYDSKIEKNERSKETDWTTIYSIYSRILYFHIHHLNKNKGQQEIKYHHKLKTHNNIP